MTVAEFIKVIPDTRQRAIALNIITHAPELGAFPLALIDNVEHKYRRESTLGTAQTVALGGLATFSDGAASALITSNLKEYNQAFKHAQALGQTLAEATFNSLKSLTRKIQRDLIHGDDSVDTNAFDGLEVVTVANSSQVIDNEDASNLHGQALTTADLREGADRVRTGPPDLVMMHEREVRAYLTLLEAKGGTTAAMVQMPNFGGGPVLTLSHSRGVTPVVANNWIGELNGVSGLTVEGSNDRPYGVADGSVTDVNDANPQADTTLTVTTGANMTAGRYYVAGVDRAEALTRDPFQAVSKSTNDITISRTPTGTGSLDIDDNDLIYASDLGKAYFVHLDQEQGLHMWTKPGTPFMDVINTGHVGDDTQTSSSMGYLSLANIAFVQKSTLSSSVVEGISG